MLDYARIRQTATMDKVCALIGIPVRHGFAICPFHGDSNASMRVYPDDRGFYCFGCHQGGDVIDFCALLLHKSKAQAAADLAMTFCVPETQTSKPKAQAAAEKRRAEQRRLALRDAANALAGMYREQRANLSRYAPSREQADAPWPEAFAAACNLLPAIESALDAADMR